MSTPQISTPDLMTLGRTDIQISALGIGTWAWGDSLFWGYGGKAYTDDDLRQAFQVCREQGITFFDTAEIYGLGRSEQLLGQFLQETSSELVMATKFMPLPWRLSAKSLTAALRESLKRLQMARLDLYQIHWPFPPMAIEVWVNALADAVDEGLTRTVGVSNYSASQMRRAHATLGKREIPLASNQVQYSLLHRDPEQNGVMEACQELGVTLIAYSPLAMGFLTSKYDVENLPSGPRGLGSKEKLKRCQPLIDLLRDIGKAYDKTPIQVALNWVICKGALPIPGAKTLKQAQENAGALGWRLSKDDVHALDTLSEQIQS